MRLRSLFRVAPAAALALLILSGCSTPGQGAAPAASPSPSYPVRTGVWPGSSTDLAFYVETVTASPGESKYGKAAPAACMQTNFFARGERVVWHIAAVDTRTGHVVLPEDVRSARLKLPGVSPDIDINFIKHGKTDQSPMTWNAAWDIPPDYPLGVIPFQVAFQLKSWPAGKVATFTQIPISLEQMTVIDHR